MSTINGRLLNIPNVNDFKEHLDALEANKQNNLIPGENIKNIDGNSIVGSGNVPFKTLNGEQLSGEGNIDIHNEPLIIKTSFSSGNILYDGTEAVEAEISPITTVTEPVEYTYDSQLKFYRESLNEEQLDSVYYIGVNKPITTTIQITNEKVPTPIDADGILKVFTPSFTDIFTEQEIEVSSKACLYVKKTEPDKPEDAYLQFGNGNDNSGWIKLKLNKKQAYLYIKAKMFKASERPGSIFVVEDLSKLDDIDFDASEIADNLVFNYSETLVTSENEWQIIKVPVQSESQIVYITNGRNFGNPGGPSITCDYKRDEYGHIDWERNIETGEIIGGRVDWDHELYGGRILIKEIGIQYEEELEAKTLFTADQFADYKATADYRFTNIEEVNEAQYSYLNEIDTHLNKVDEEFTEKFNNLGDVQIYTVDKLPERVHVEDKSKIFKCDNHYYVADINNSYVDTTTRFTFKNNRHTFSNNITTTGSLASSFSQIYDTSNSTTLMSNFELPDGSITSENKLFGSGNTYKSDTQNADLFGNKYLRFGAKSAGGKLVLEYIDPSNTKALTQISFKLLPWINVTSTVNPETSERVKHIDSLNRSAIKIYRNTEDNLIDAALIDCGSIVSGEYEYSQEGFDSLVDNCANSWYFEIQLMPGDKIIIKSANNVIINGEEITGLDYRFFIVGINITTENTKVKFKEPFVTTDTDQHIEGKKSFNQTITISNSGGDNALINIDGSDGIYNFLSYHPEFASDASYLVLDHIHCINPNTNGYGLCAPSTGSYIEDKTIATEEYVDNALLSKADLVNGLVPASQLPSYVDDVLESSDAAHFPSAGEEGKIYVALDTGFTYRWSGSEYVQIGGQDLSNFVTLGTDQTIAGNKSFSNELKLSSTYGNGTSYSIEADDDFGQLRISHDNTRLVTVNDTGIMPNGTRNLGGSSYPWKDLYLSGTSNYTANNKTFKVGVNPAGTALFTYGGNDVAFLSNASTWIFNCNIVPNNATDLGSSSNKWRNLHLSGNLFVPGAIGNDINLTSVTEIHNSIWNTQNEVTSGDKLEVTQFNTIDSDTNISINNKYIGYEELKGLITNTNTTNSIVVTFLHGLKAFLCNDDNITFDGTDKITIPANTSIEFSIVNCFMCAVNFSA